MNFSKLKAISPGAVVMLLIFTFAAAISLLSGPVRVSAQKGDDSLPNFAPESVFTGANLGAIPDGGAACAPSPGANRDITFSVTGIAAAPTSVSVSMTATHSFVGDVTAVLIAPNGATTTVFGRTGAITAAGVGDSSDLNATYTFSDTAPAQPSGGWWQEANVRGAGEFLTSGVYRSTGLGGLGQINPAPATNLTAAFAAIPSSNGTWTLRLTDGCSGDTGAITAASLVLNAAAPVIKAPNDISGDGKSDFTVLRADGPVSLAETQGVNDTFGKMTAERLQQRSEAPTARGVTWYTADSNQNPYSTFLHGIDTTDYFLSADMVGDNKSDLVVWRPGTGGIAGFYILDPSNATVSFRPFGQTNDICFVVGDYDGDGKKDLAVWRPGAQGVFYWAPVSNPNAITAISWGTTNDFPFVFDYDGDGKADVAIQRSGGGGVGQYWIRRSSDGVAEVINGYGKDTDFVVPGDYNGDGRDDLCVSRTTNFGSGTYKYFFPRDSVTGNVTFIQWGIPGDVITPGDYDGDGKMDIAIWRSSGTGQPGTFYVMKSSGGSQTFVYGLGGDYPIANWNVH
ncbi:hypothetical protein BH10ACI3_BH10ACI3_22940 [soil metagenome]